MSRRPGKAGLPEKLLVWTLLVLFSLLVWWLALGWIRGAWDK